MLGKLTYFSIIRLFGYVDYCIISLCITARVVKLIIGIIYIPHYQFTFSLSTTLLYIPLSYS